MYNHNYVIFRDRLTAAYVHGFSLKLSDWIISFSIWRRCVELWIVFVVICNTTSMWKAVSWNCCCWYDMNMKVHVNLKARFFEHDIYVVMFFMFQLTINLILIPCRYRGEHNFDTRHFYFSVIKELINFAHGFTSISFNVYQSIFCMIWSFGNT